MRVALVALSLIMWSTQMPLGLRYYNICNVSLLIIKAAASHVEAACFLAPKKANYSCLSFALYHFHSLSLSLSLSLFRMCSRCCCCAAQSLFNIILHKFSLKLKNPTKFNAKSQASKKKRNCHDNKIWI